MVPGIPGPAVGASCRCRRWRTRPGRRGGAGHRGWRPMRPRSGEDQRDRDLEMTNEVESNEERGRRPQEPGVDGTGARWRGVGGRAGVRQRDWSPTAATMEVGDGAGGR
jgi:hypothetical protein